MKPIRAEAGKSTKILSKFSNSITTTYTFSASVVDGEHAPSGTVEVKGSSWIFPKPATTQPLQASNSVTKTMWDVFFRVNVIPDQDVRIEFEGGKVQWPLRLAVLVISVIGIAAAIMVISFGNAP